MLGFPLGRYALPLNHLSNPVASFYLISLKTILLELGGKTTNREGSYREEGDELRRESLAF